jgi:3-hydroxyacyl-CoA dehydrogenase/3a,7a,12a-trihydroxy-5b-cholest-24-enoyl-CoA hydratase
MEVVTPRDFLEKVLPKRFNASKAAGIDVIVQVSITGDNGGNWSVTIKDQKLEAKEETTSSPTLSITMAEKDFVDLINGRISAEKAFFTGKIQFKGNIGLALKLKETGFL